MTITIKLKDLLNESLEMNFIADDLFKYINNLKEDKILLDFKGIEFISLAFAQEYVYQKQNSFKRIYETNLSKEVKPMLRLVETRKKR